jgi:hypothetical protein
MLCAQVKFERGGYLSGAPTLLERFLQEQFTWDRWTTMNGKCHEALDLEINVYPCVLGVLVLCCTEIWVIRS